MVEISSVAGVGDCGVIADFEELTKPEQLIAADDTKTISTAGKRWDCTERFFAKASLQT